MNYPTCFHVYHSIGNNRKSQTLQPIRGCDHYAKFMLSKNYNSQIDNIVPDQENYANLGPAEPDSNETLAMTISSNNQLSHSQRICKGPVQLPNRDIHQQHQRQLGEPQSILSSPSVAANQHNTFHCRSLSHLNEDLNNYYNLSPSNGRADPRKQPPQVARTRHLKAIEFMQVCNELGVLDSAPPLPPSRQYSISQAHSGFGLYKLEFPHRRYVNQDYVDPVSKTALLRGQLVLALRPSKSNRSKFTVILLDNNQSPTKPLQFDVPHQITLAPQPAPLWN